MITLFTIPRFFKPPFDVIQRNAIKSWQASCPDCEIIMFGEEGGAAEAARDLGIVHIPEIKRSEFGTPIFDYIFAKTKEIARYDILAYVNADIILMDDFFKTVARVRKLEPGQFLMVGQRWDANINEPLEFGENWSAELRKKVKEQGRLLGPSGMDYWVFPKDLAIDYPAFTIGRVASDGWLVSQARKQQIPVIDVTKSLMVVHQNHYYPQKKQDSYELEVKRNIDLAGGLYNVMTLRDANWVLTDQGIKRPPFPRRIFTELAFFPLWRYLLVLKRKITSRL